MASFKSKHQNQYQWQEIQDLVQNFARQVREKNEREQQALVQRPPLNQDAPNQDTPSAPPSPDQSPPQKSTSKVPTKPYSELNIDLQRFRNAWKRQQAKQHEPEALQSKDSVSPLATPLTQWDFENHRPVSIAVNNVIPSKEQAISQSSQPTRQGFQTENPWEMLRDHFIALRERRIALEKQKSSESQA